MKKFYKIVSVISLFVMVLFLGIGYAAITSNLSINGHINAVPAPFNGVEITKIEIESSSNSVESLNMEFIKPTNISTTVNVIGDDYITYKVTVFNNSSITYYYQGIKYIEEYENNNYIGSSNGITIITKDKLTDSNGTFDEQDWIPSQQYRDFYVTYQYGSNVIGDVVTLINFHFDIHVDSVVDNFAAILNDPVKYETISNMLDENYSETGSKVMGNVGDDAALFESLFGKKLTVTVDGEEKPLTIMVRKENVDGKSTGDSFYDGTSGCEYTVYMTVDDLNGSGTAQTYAVTFTKGEDGQWYQIGQIYEGTTTIVDNGSYNSIDVYEWKANPKEYELADGITYKVGQSQGDQYDKINSLEELMSTVDQDIYNDIDNSKYFKKIYDIIVANNGSDSPEILGLRNVFMNGSKYYINYNNGQEFKVVRDYSRAELASFISELQKALDYYNQVHIS